MTSGSCIPPAFPDLSVFDADGSVGKLCNLLIVSDHDNCLVELSARHFNQPQHILAGFGIQIPGGFHSKLYPYPLMP